MVRGSNLAGGEFKIDRPHLDCKWRSLLLYQSSEIAALPRCGGAAAVTDRHCKEEQI